MGKTFCLKNSDSRILLCREVMLEDMGGGDDDGDDNMDDANDEEAEEVNLAIFTNPLLTAPPFLPWSHCEL